LYLPFDFNSNLVLNDSSDLLFIFLEKSRVTNNFISLFPDAFGDILSLKVKSFFLLTLLGSTNVLPTPNKETPVVLAIFTL
jgi:hypothetical protein